MIMTILLITFLEDRKHDAGVLRDFHMLDDLRLHAYFLTGQVICVHGGPAWPLRAHLEAPFRAGVGGLTLAMELYNKDMSKVRTSVEWIFGGVIN